MTRRYKLYWILILIFGICIILKDKLDLRETLTTSKPLTPNEYSLYLAGTYAKKTSDFDAATNFFDKLEKLDSSPEIKKSEYILAIIEGDFKRAAEVAPEKENTANFVKVAMSVKEGNFDQARKDLNKVQESKQEILKHLLSAWVYAGQNNKTAAYNALGKINSKGLTSLINQNKLYLAINLKDEKTINELLPKFQKENISIRAAQLLVQYYCQQAKFEEAQKVVNEKIIDESMASLLNSYIQNYKAGDSNIFSNVNDGFSEAFSNFALLIFNPANWELSMFFTQLSLYLTPDHEFSKVLLAEVWEARNVIDKANAIYLSIPKTSYLYPSTQLKYANNLYKTGDKEKGIKIFKRIISKYPFYMTAYMYLGEKYIEQANYKKALEIFSSAEKQIKDNKKATDWKIYYYLALCNDKLGKFDKVEDLLATALVLSPNNPVVQNYLGYFWIDHDKNQDNALKMIEQAVISNPLDIDYIDSFAWALYKMGKQKEAIRLLELCVSRNATHAPIRIHLGEAYYDQGKFRDARYQWEVAELFNKGLSDIEKEDLKEKLKSVEGK